MLVISRKENQKIKIGENIEITIVSIDKGQIKIGIDAPKDVTILRSELLEEIKNENLKAVREVDENELKNLSTLFKGNE